MGTLTQGRRTVVVLVLSLLMVGLAARAALANVRGERCVNHSLAGIQITVCPAVNVHDLLGKHEAIVTMRVSNLDHYIDWVKLYRNGNLVQTVQQDRWVASLGQVTSTDWEGCHNTSDDWQAKVRAKYRTPGGTVSQFFTDSSYVVHDGPCG